MVRLAITALIVLFPASLFAQNTPFAMLRYERAHGAEQCFDESTLRDAVSARLGYVPFLATAPQSVRVRIARRGQHLRATVALYTGSELTGERSLLSSGSDCTELLQALALAISVAIDPLSLSRVPTEIVDASAPNSMDAAVSIQDATTEVFSQDPPDVMVTQTPDAELPVSRSNPTPVVNPSPSLRVFFALMAVGSLGSAPDVTIGGNLAVGLRYRAISLAVEGRIDGGATRASQQVVGRVFGALRLGTLMFCAHWRWFGVCPEASFGVLDGQGLDVMFPQNAQTFFASLGLRVQFDVTLWGPLSFRSQLGLAVPLTPTNLLLDSVVVWTTPIVYAGLAAGLAITFP